MCVCVCAATHTQECVCVCAAAHTQECGSSCFSCSPPKLLVSLLFLPSISPPPLHLFSLLPSSSMFSWVPDVPQAPLKKLELTRENVSALLSGNGTLKVKTPTSLFSRGNNQTSGGRGPGTVSLSLTHTHTDTHTFKSLFTQRPFHMQMVPQ